MNPHFGRLLLALLAFAAIVPGTTRLAQAAGCSASTLTVGAVPVSIELCPTSAAPGHGATQTGVPMLERISANGHSFVRSVVFRFLAGDPSSRVIDDLDLAPLGLQGTLHLTILRENGQPRIVRALLTPGALPIPVHRNPLSVSLIL